MIESYSFGKITIDGENYTNDVIIYPENVKNNWWRNEGHRLNPEDIEEVIEFDPEVLIVGTGSNGRMNVPDRTRDYVESNDIELIVKKTDEACKKYNNISKSKKTVAALHLTC